MFGNRKAPQIPGQIPPPPPSVDPTQCRSLYVGNLPETMTDALLYEIFSTVGPVQAWKLIRDKTGKCQGYGFVDFYDHQTAVSALQNFYGRPYYGVELRVNWAMAGAATQQSNQKEDTSGHVHLFVGDLASDIDDQKLLAAFSAHGTPTDARVMWDHNTGRSRGYGFVAYRTRPEAEAAMKGMDGERLQGRQIRVNWANQKNQQSSGGENNTSSVENTNNTTMYIGNLSPEVTEAVLDALCNPFGDIENIKLSKGFGFVKFANHDSAKKAIEAVNGQPVAGKNVKASWGKHREQSNNAQGNQMFQQNLNSYPSQYGFQAGGMNQQFMFMQPSQFGQQFYDYSNMDGMAAGLGGVNGAAGMGAMGSLGMGGTAAATGRMGAGPMGQTGVNQATLTQATAMAQNPTSLQAAQAAMTQVMGQHAAAMGHVMGGQQVAAPGMGQPGGAGQVGQAGMMMGGNNSYMQPANNPHRPYHQ